MQSVAVTGSTRGRTSTHTAAYVIPRLVSPRLTRNIRYRNVSERERERERERKMGIHPFIVYIIDILWKRVFTP